MMPTEVATRRARQTVPVERQLTLVTPDKSDDERDRVATAWQDGSGTVLRLDRFWEPPPIDPSSVRLYGNDTFCLVLAEVLGLTLVSPPDDLLLRVAASCLGRGVLGTTLEEAGSLAFPCFVKPIVPKQFRAAVYKDVEALLTETHGLEQDARLFVSEPVTFSAEVRCFVLDGDVVTAACYEGAADIVAARAFARAFVADAPLPTTSVLDVGMVNGAWCIIEANATWGSGLNGCDPRAVVECLKVATHT